jgi:hypothetical protein
LGHVIFYPRPFQRRGAAFRSGRRGRELLGAWALFRENVSVGGSFSYRVLPAGVGVLPLFNVALIGTWHLAANWRWSLRHGRARNPRSPFPGITYFSFQFLTLIIVASLSMPDVNPSVQRVVGANVVTLGRRALGKRLDAISIAENPAMRMESIGCRAAP